MPENADGGSTGQQAQIAVERLCNICSKHSTQLCALDLKCPFSRILNARQARGPLVTELRSLRSFDGTAVAAGGTPLRSADAEAPLGSANLALACRAHARIISQNIAVAIAKTAIRPWGRSDPKMYGTRAGRAPGSDWARGQTAKETGDPAPVKVVKIF